MLRREIDRDVKWLKIHGKENPTMNRKSGDAHLTYMPEVGFRMILESVGDCMGIVTTTVSGVEQLSNGLLVRTLNSIYYLEYAL